MTKPAKYHVMIGNGWLDGDGGVVFGIDPDASALRLTWNTALELRREWNRFNRLAENRGRRNERVSFKRVS